MDSRFDPRVAAQWWQPVAHLQRVVLTTLVQTLGCRIPLVHTVIVDVEA
jgi:hypothetical protein